jgi:hypothetical protein
MVIQKQDQLIYLKLIHVSINWCYRVIIRPMKLKKWQLTNFFCIIIIIDYRDIETLKKKLTIAISNAEGFGLE